MAEGYTSEDVNRVFGRMRGVFGVELVCVWDYFDAYGRGLPNLLRDRHGLHELAGDLWSWLNDDPNDPATPHCPGSPATWLGAPAEVPACPQDDGPTTTSAGTRKS